MITLALILCTIACLMLGVLVLLRGRRLVNLLFAGICICFASWATFILIFLNTADVTVALVSAKAYYVAAAAFAGLLLVFTLAFPEGKAPPKKKLLLILPATASIILSLILYPSFITDGIRMNPGNNTVIVDRPSYLLFSIYFVIYFYLGISVAIHKYLKRKGHERVQIGAYAFGILLNSIPGVITNLILPYLGNYRYIWVGPLCSTFFVAFTAYSIVRYRMFDIRTFVIRAAGYLLTSTLLSILYIAPVLYLVGTVLMGFPFGWRQFVIGVLVATVAAYNFNRLRTWFDAKTAEIFFRDTYDPAVILGDFTRLLVSTIDIKQLLNDSSDFIASKLRVEAVGFVLNETTTSELRVTGPYHNTLAYNDVQRIIQHMANNRMDVVAAELLTSEYAALKRVLQAHRVAVIIRLSNKGNNNKDLGFMLIDYKKSGNPYTAQDLRTLGSMADVMVIAIQNALHFEEIQDFNLTLQQKVYDATAQLRRTNSKLKALDETKDDFISMASHQLRTPLTSVKGYLSMVLEGDAGSVTPIQRKMLDQAFVSSQRMVFLIADLLNVSRLKTGKFVIEPTRVNLSKLIGDEVNQLKETAKARSLELIYDKPTDFPELMIDDTKIRQVIMNFIDNAIYYTPSGGTIRIELNDRPEAVEFRVVDTGIGVPKHEQPHLFTKFYRAGNARQARPDGTGLGLFMAKKVIVAQGGAIIFNSQEGKGSTFGFILSKHKLAVPTISAPKVPELTAAK